MFLDKADTASILFYFFTLTRNVVSTMENNYFKQGQNVHLISRAPKKIVRTTFDFVLAYNIAFCRSDDESD